MYEVKIETKASRESRRFPIRDLEKILESLSELKKNPRPSGCRKLTTGGGYRVRVGNYRILYRVNDAMEKVTVYGIKRRSGQTYR